MLRELGLPRYGLHVPYSGHNAIPHSNVTILREVNSYSIPPKAIGQSGVTKLKNKVLNPYAAEPRVCRFRQCPCLHLCFATACCHTAGRSLSRGRFHKIFGSYAASSRMNHLQRRSPFTSLSVLSGLQWCPPYYGGFTLQLGSHRCRRDIKTHRIGPPGTPTVP